MKNSFSNWTSIIHRFLLLWLALISTRLIFWGLNASYFDLEAIDFMYTIPFDLSTIALYCLPLLLIHFFPLNKRYAFIKKRVASIIFYVILISIIFLNMWDSAYFSFSQRRTSFDVFLFLIQSPDNGLFRYFLVDYFWISLAALALITLFIFLDLYLSKKIKEIETPIKFQFLHLIMASAVFFVIGRWSFGPKPLGVLDANKYTHSENVPFILNTAFVTLKTIQSEQFPSSSLIDLKESYAYFNPIKSVQQTKQNSTSKNVVFIILESFGDKMIHQTINGIKLTPFTDSLLNQSCYFKNGIANGKQSIEAIPAIFASIPNLMATPYILSSFCNNKLNGLPSILKTKGYTSAFFHGAKNGSMRFDSFSKKLGFDTYFGMNEYPIRSHYDGLWGIPDGYFNPWALSKINKMKEPFLASIFTISSHHPYKIPIKLENKISKNLTKEQQSFYYADQSLRRFFKQAQKFPWFKNTIFVICADHTPQQLDGKSATNFEKFNIPIAFFTPDKSILPEKNLAYFQQIDILPYLLKQLGITTKYYAFGNDSHQSGGLVYLNGNYLFLENQGELIFNEIEKTATYIDKTKGKRILFENKTLTLRDKQLLLLVKSVIERYRNDLRNNKTSVK